MRSVNKVILVGRLGKDAETTYTPTGTGCTKFSVATDRRWKDEKSGEWKGETDWTNVVAWKLGKLADYPLKGAQVYIEGQLRTRSYDNKDGKKVDVTEVNTTSQGIVLFFGGGKDERRIGAPGSPAKGNDLAAGVDDDDVPF